MMRAFIELALICSSLVLLAGCTGRIGSEIVLEGTVLEAGTMDPVTGAFVQIQQDNNRGSLTADAYSDSGITDEEGNYTLGIRPFRNSSASPVGIGVTINQVNNFGGSQTVATLLLDAIEVEPDVIIAAETYRQDFLVPAHGFAEVSFRYSEPVWLPEDQVNVTLTGDGFNYFYRLRSTVDVNTTHRFPVIADTPIFITYEGGLGLRSVSGSDTLTTRPGQTVAFQFDLD